MSNDDLLQEYINKIKNIIFEKNCWISIYDIAEILGVKRHDLLISGVPNTTIAHIIHLYLKKDYVQSFRINYKEGGYSIWVAPKGLSTDFIPESAYIKIQKYNSKKEKKIISKNETCEIKNDDLKNILIKYRLEKSHEEQIPAYCIFQNKVIDGIVNILPNTKEELLSISGFGKNKIEKYGDDIIKIINDFSNKHEPIVFKDIKINKVNEEVVLKCIQEFDKKFSYNGIIKILMGYVGFRWIPKVKTSEYFGIYKHSTEIEIEKAINHLIDCDIVENNYKIGIKTDNLDNQKEFHESNLKKIFGHEKFKDWQWNVIKNLLNNKRILSIEKTGGGKSLCFQYVAQHLYLEGKGTTIVFSPLQALMREQVQYLKSIGVKAECIITSKKANNEIETTEEEHKKIYEKLINNEISLLYIAPERLNNTLWLEYVSKIKIAMIVVDEAHCISTWGHDFRIDYRRIVDLIKLLPNTIPVLCLTATANDIVANDIKEQVGKNLQIMRGKLERTNLNLNVLKTKNNKEKFLFLKTFIDFQEGHGIVYVGTQADTKIFSDWLNFAGIKSEYYHAGLSDEKRTQLEEDLQNNKYKVIVSTNALGMGMDKKDVRFVIHIQMPSSLIAYYQEIGRAGRDNLPSNILLLYNSDDEELQKYFIETSKPSKLHYIQTLKNLKQYDLGLFALTKNVNVRKKTMELILKDLQDRGNVERLENLKYSFVKDMTDEEYELINQYKQIRYEDLDKMLKYVHLKTCRTSFICSYLNDYSVEKCNHCDNCSNSIKLNISEKDSNLLKEFFDNYFIYEEKSYCTIVSSGYYKTEDIGNLIKDAKYRHKGYFSEQLLDRVIKAYYKYYKNSSIDCILFVPPTISGDLVENFAYRISKKINIPMKKDLFKQKETDVPLKEIKNKLRKRELLKDVYVLNNCESYIGKNILLIDDIIDSGITVEEISKMLKKAGVNNVNVLTIAKTTVGDE